MEVMGRMNRVTRSAKQQSHVTKNRGRNRGTTYWPDRDSFAGHQMSTPWTHSIGHTSTEKPYGPISPHHSFLQWTVYEWRKQNPGGREQSNGAYCAPISRVRSRRT